MSQSIPPALILVGAGGIVLVAIVASRGSGARNAITPGQSPALFAGQVQAYQAEVAARQSAASQGLDALLRYDQTGKQYDLSKIQLFNQAQSDRANIDIVGRQLDAQVAATNKQFDLASALQTQQFTIANSALDLQRYKITTDTATNNAKTAADAAAAEKKTAADAETARQKAALDYQKSVQDTGSNIFLSILKIIPAIFGIVL